MLKRQVIVTIVAKNVVPDGQPDPGRLCYSGYIDGGKNRNISTGF